MMDLLFVIMEFLGIVLTIYGLNGAIKKRISVEFFRGSVIVDLSGFWARLLGIVDACMGIVIIIDIFLYFAANALLVGDISGKILNIFIVALIVDFVMNTVVVVLDRIGILVSHAKRRYSAKD